MAIVIEVPEYICTDYEKITETDYSHLIGKQLDMVQWYEKLGLYAYAMENGIYNWTTKQKIKFLKDVRGITIVKSEDGQIQLEGMIE